MADQRENDISPTGLGLSFDNRSNASEPQHDALQGPREVEDLTDENFHDFDRDFTNDVEPRGESLRITADHTPTDAHEVGSQPGSAFSPSSSEGDEDAADEDEEQDENDKDFEQAEEWHEVDIRNLIPLPAHEPYPIYPAIRGMKGHNTIYRVDPLNGVTYPMHKETIQNEFEFKAKMDQYSNRPSKRQKILTSPPLSPDYNNTGNTGMPADMGVIPEPSPEAEEDDHVVSPLPQHEASKPVSEQHNFATDRVWSEEDEEDMSWVSGAIAEVTGSRRGSAESVNADLPGNDTGAANVPESSDDAVSPLSPVSPLDKAGALDALKDDSDPSVEVTAATPSESPDQHPESSQEESVTVAMVVEPVSDLPPLHERDPTSPDPAGPEFLTGLTPEEGMKIWWQWHDRPDKPSFNTNRNPFNQDRSGDFKFAIDGSGKEEAAVVLSKRRFLLNRMTSRDVTCISDTMSDVETALEYMRIQMLKYRHQRNDYRDQRNEWRLDAEALEARVGRRDDVIKEQDERIARRNNTIQEQEDKIQEKQKEINDAEKVFFQAVEQVRDMGTQKEKAFEAAKAMRAQREEALEAVKAMRAEKENLTRMLEQKIDDAQRELGGRKEPLQFASIMTVISQDPVAGEASDSDQHELQLQSRVDDLTRQLNESQASRATLDETYTALHGRIAELEKELARIVSEQLDNTTKVQTEAEADELRAQLQTRFNIESELAKLQSRNNELEDELRTLAMTRRGNGGSDADLADRIQEADALARDQQAEIERLQDESVAWQRYADESIAAIQAELDAAHEEGNGLKDALMEHGWSAYAPSRKHTMPLMNDQGTQTENRAPSALPKSPVKAVPAPLKATKKQQTHKQAFDQTSNWAERKKAIMQSPSAVEQLESLRVAREKRQAEELERLDQIRQRMEAYWNLDEQLYVPLEAGRAAVVVRVV
jgi:hypothetical protein